jgi:hypothetical protein
MEVICSSETSVAIQRTTRRYIPEDITLHNHRCEHLKSCKISTLNLISPLWLHEGSPYPTSDVPSAVSCWFSTRNVKHVTAAIVLQVAASWRQQGDQFVYPVNENSNWQTEVMIMCCLFRYGTMVEWWLVGERWRMNFNHMHEALSLLICMYVN